MRRARTVRGPLDLYVKIILVIRVVLKILQIRGAADSDVRWCAHDTSVHPNRLLHSVLAAQIDQEVPEAVEPWRSWSKSLTVLLSVTPTPHKRSGASGRSRSAFVLRQKR